ncbi:MAG TPA: trypsin-like serine protease [Jatrophihabitans sp.]|nr:trypsin-like serine protease [Jatrophihabitans sp.]
MQVRKILITAAAGASLAGLVATAAPGVAGASGTSAKAAPAAALAKTTLVTSSGKTVTPAAAAKLAGASANVRGHNGYVPTKGLAKPTGGMRPNSIIGSDSRTQVTATTTFPNSAVVLINRSGIGLWCTGWMVGKDTLLSAGHCVTDGAGTWYSGLSFVPGSNGGNAPFGTCYPRAIYAFTAWASGADSNYDTSIVKLNCTVGYSTGWFGTWWQSASPDGLFTRVQGYPGDKPSTQWQSFDYVRASSADRLYYQNDTIGGESGSPVWQYRSGPYCSGACGMGVHTNGSNGTNNSGVRFTQGKLNAIYGIVNAP